MSSSRDTPQCKDSSINLLKLFNGGRPDHRVVTRQDLTTDYPSNDNDNNDSPRSPTSDSTVAINNYYTWNSSRTNSPIHKYAWRVRTKADYTRVYKYFSNMII